LSVTIGEIGSETVSDPNTRCVQLCGNPYAYFNVLTRQCVCEASMEDKILVNPDGLSRQRRNDGIIPNDPTRHDRGIGVYNIDTARDASGRKLTGSRRLEALRIRKNSKRTRRSERSEITSRQELKNLSVTLGLDKNTALLSTAMRILEEAIKQKLVKGFNRKYFAAAAIYKAAVTHGVNVSIHSISRHYGGDFAREKMWDALTKLEKNGITRKVIPDASKRVASVKEGARRALVEIGNKLELNQKTILSALKLLEKIDRVVRVQGRSSYAVAATTLFLASRFYGLEPGKLIQKNISKASNIVDATIRKTYTRLFKDTVVIVYIGEKRDVGSPLYQFTPFKGYHTHSSIPQSITTIGNPLEART